MARVAGLHQIALRVPNLDAVADFYKNLWGMEQVKSGGDERNQTNHLCLLDVSDLPDTEVAW